MLARILLASTHENDWVLDPFAGSCTTGIAANLMNRRFVGIDKTEEYLQLGIRRREELTDPRTPPISATTSPTSNKWNSWD